MATLKNTSINDTGFLKLPNGTTAQRPVSPNTGMIRYNQSSYPEYYNGYYWLNMTTGVPGPIFHTKDLAMNIDVSAWNGTSSTIPDIYNDISVDGVGAYNATLYGTIINQNGLWGNAPYFEPNQITDYLSFNTNCFKSLTNKSVYTYETWLKLWYTDSTSNRYMHSWASPSVDNVSIVQIEGYNIRSYNLTRISGGDLTFTDGEVFQFVIVSDGTNQYWYKNANLVATYSGTQSTETVTGWTFNQEQDSSNGSFDPSQSPKCMFIGLRLYNSALSQIEINYNFQNGRTRVGV